MGEVAENLTSRSSLLARVALSILFLPIAIVVLPLMVFFVIAFVLLATVSGVRDAMATRRRMRRLGRIATWRDIEHAARSGEPHTLILECRTLGMGQFHLWWMPCSAREMGIPPRQEWTGTNNEAEMRAGEAHSRWVWNHLTSDHGGKAKFVQAAVVPWRQQWLLRRVKRFLSRWPGTELAEPAPCWVQLGEREEL